MTLHEQSIGVYRSRIDTLTGLLTKAAAHADGDALLGAKLADDMLPLAAQVRFVANIPCEALTRLKVGEFASSELELTSFAEAKALASQTAKALDAIKPEDLPTPDERVEFSIGDGAYHFEMSAEAYIRDFSLPNFYFHLTSAYAILRMQGVDLGKADFIPHMAQYFKAPAS